MAQQILIIGLGQFGMSLANTLTEKGAEVLAVDTDRNLVEEAARFATHALILNATDEVELARLEPGKRDVAVCCIGDDSREASIICTALLRQMGTPLIVARASDRMHQRILRLVGAHQIVNPELEFGRRFANRILYSNVIVDTNLGDDLHLTEISPQESIIGKTLIELSLPSKYGVMVAGVRRAEDGRVVQPLPDEPIRAKDHLILVSSEPSIARLVKEL